ncbi:WD repeat-containing protein 65 [Stegastes partitus]|uniref:WD repeat-containing protein 65 n=1 Tax=Stegastes partitus TaxID=144197 RepID=A0A9Y4NBJ8_9TELE|nr:PREDICTED: WD repeat-containing protein 65 [Stegastes partitus]
MAAVVAQSRFIFGLRTGVKNGLCFCDEETLVFPSGNSCVCYNTVQRSQRFISAGTAVFATTPSRGVRGSFQGEFYNIGKHQEPPFSPADFSLPPQIDRMLYIGMSVFTANSAAFVYNKAGALSLYITDDMIPQGSPFRLNTKTFGIFIPQIAKQFPGLMMKLLVKTVKDPIITFQPNNVTVQATATVTAYAIQPNATLAPLFVLNLHEQGRKRKVLTAGDMLVQEFVCMAFSPDSKYLIGQAGGPEWMLIFWLWEKHKVLATVKTTSSNNPVTQVSFNPYNNMQLCVIGSGVFKLFRYSEGAIKQSSFAKVESINFLCHAWMSEERVIAGTDTGRLLVFEYGDLRREVKATSKAVQGQSDRQVEMKKMTDSDVDESPAVPRITAILSYSKGFVCSVGPGTVCLFEKTEEDSYRKSREVKIPPCRNDLNPAECQEVYTMCISPAEETLAISTDRGQLYGVSLSSVDMNKEEQLHFEFLSQPFHSDSITGLSICIRKPLVATSSLDRSVHIWNYETKVLELYKEFQEEAHSVALHPTGLFILVGFSDKLRLMNLVIDDIRAFKEFTVRSCQECAFSHGGHLFAAVSGNIIHIYSVTSFENILSLKGHNGKVRGIKWSLDDSRLVSCGMDGAVYQWNTQTGKRESESILKSCSYTGVAFSADCKTILAVGTDLTLKEIQDCQVLKEVPADEVAHTALAVSHSGRVVFTGTASGTIRAIKYPLPIQKDWIVYQAHCGPVTKMAITYDEQFLLTVSEDGCLLVWTVIDKEGRRLKSNTQIVHTEEILVTKSDLEEKSQNMLELKMRLEELQMESEYQLRLRDMNHNEKLKELSDKFSQQIELLKTTQQSMKTEMEKQSRENQENSVEVAMKHSKELKDLESSCSQKLIVEHEKYQDLQQKYERMQKEYERQLKSAEEHKTQALECLTQQCESKLQEKTQLLAQCQGDAQQQIRTFKEIIKQTEETEEEMINDIQIKYEKKLFTEKEINTNLKGENAILTQKFYGLQRQIDDRCTDITKLKQERQRLLELIRSLESDIEDLKRQISGHEKTGQDKDNTISGLKKKNQELEKLKFVLEFQLSELKKQTEPQRDDIEEKKERIRQLEEALFQTEKSNTQLQLTVSDLRLKLKTRDKEMHKEMQKVTDLETHLQRLRSDLHNCVSFIQDPKKLKDSVKRIYTKYVQQTDEVEKSSLDDDIQKTFRKHCDHLEETITSLKNKLALSAEEHEKVYVKIMKENMTLITEINELRKELHLLRTQVKDYKVQLAALKKKKSHPNPEEGAPKEPKQKDIRSPQPPSADF